MRIRTLIAGAFLMVCGVSSASATMLISEDRGGQIGQYLQAFATLRSSGENVIIDGNCFSACTLVLGLIPRERICATSRAKLGFHAAWMPDETGRPVTSPMGTQALWSIYPSKVRSWINRNGGLSRKMIFMQGSDLNGVVASCDSTRTARSSDKLQRRAISRAMRYSASASNSGR